MSGKVPRGYKKCVRCEALIPESAETDICHYCKEVEEAVKHNSSWLCATDFF